MKRSGRSVLSREMVGAALIIIAGSVLHFAFDWLGGWRPVALVAAVNESIWEHLKLAFWPGLTWAVIPPKSNVIPLSERLAVRGYTLALTAMLIVTIFLGYTRILGDNLLVLDIGTFVIAVVAGQAVAALVLIRTMRPRAMRMIGLGLLAVQSAAYSLFTYFPPDYWLFIEARSGLRGL